MGHAGDLLIVAAVVFGVNLMPAFAPPTWMVLVFFNVRFDLPAYVLIPVGALCAAAGRFLLGTAAKRFRGAFSERRIKELDVLRAVAEGRRAAAFGALTLFAISPLPSASLFIAAGVAGMRMAPLTLAFFVGRTVSYSFYVSASSIAEHSIRALLARGVTSPWTIALQVVLLAMIAGMVFVPWSRLLRRFLPTGEAPRASKT